MKITTNLTEMKKINKRLEYLKTNTVRIGVLGEGANDKQEGGLTILEYSILNEYGTSKIPARPFFREATEFGESKSIISKRIKTEVSNVASGKKTGEQALNALGTFIKGRIQKSLKSGNWTPNAPSTRKRKLKKGGVKPPLIDTGSLIRAIDYEIKRK